MDNHLHMECVEWASKRAHALTYHIAAVNGVKWSAQQQFMLSSGYDGSSNVDWYWRLRNSCFLEDEAVAVIKCHPHTIPICSFLAKGPQIMDIWWGKAVHEDVIRLGQELSLSLWLMASNVSLQVMYHTRIVVNLSSSGCFTRGTTSNKVRVFTLSLSWFLIGAAPCLMLRRAASCLLCFLSLLQSVEYYLLPPCSS